MPATEHPLTQADFDQTRWEELLSGAKKPETFSYCTEFGKALRAAKDIGDAAATAVFTVLFVVTDVELRADETDEPFGPRFVRRAARSGDPGDISDDQFAILREVGPGIQDPEMRARVCDLVWTTKRGDIGLAKAAVTAYLESATRLEDHDHWVVFEERIRRAVRLARSLGKGGVDEFTKAVAYVEGMLAKLNGEDPSFLTCRLMELLRDLKLGDPATYAPLAEKAALRAEGASDFRRARFYWECSAGWHTRAKDLPRRDTALMSAAETHVKEAEAAALFPPERSPNMSAAGHLRRAFHALQRIGTPAAIQRAKEIYLRLVDHQKKSIVEMKSTSFPVDLTEMTRLAEEAVAGKPLEQALVGIASLAQVSRKADVRKLVEESYAKHPLMGIFSSTKITNTGKITGERPHFETSGDAREEAIAAEMFSHAVHNRSLVAQGYLVPAIQKVREEHAPRLNDFLRITASSMFVPQGRELTYAKGLLAGFRGDLDVSTHLLIPQIEESIRALLAANGVITSGFDRSQSQQNEHDLNTTLIRDEMSLLFDEDTVFELRGLLVEHYGSNLRNYMAHGMLSDHELQSTDALFLWGLSLRLCIWTIPRNDSADPAAPQDEAPKPEDGG